MPDHVQPVVQGGRDEESHLITTSVTRNLAKGIASLAELKCLLRLLGNMAEWAADRSPAVWYLRMRRRGTSCER